MTALRCSASITPVVTVTDRDTGERAHVGVDVALDLGAERAAGDGQGHLDPDGAVLLDPDRGHHAELHDVGPQLGVDHAAQRGPDRLLGRHRVGAGGTGSDGVGPGHPANCTGRDRAGHPMGCTAGPWTRVRLGSERGARQGRGPRLGRCDRSASRVAVQRSRDQEEHR